MEKKHHNLKLIIPSKENELFSIAKYQKMSSDIFANSFFSTQYKSYNKTNNFSSFDNNKKKIKLLLNPFNSTGLKYQTNYNISNSNKSTQIPFPSFPNKRPIQSLYKNTMKLVKYPKIVKDNFTIYNFNKINFPKIKDEEKKYNNTFNDSKMNAETQTFSSYKTKTQYKGQKHLMNLNVSPIKKPPKIKYSYKLYNFENEKNIKNQLKKKLNINNFDTVLNNIKRLIEMRDEHNNEIKYDKVINLLLDEIYNFIQDRIKKKQNKIKRKKYKNISTSYSQKNLNRKDNRLDSSIEELASLSKKIRFKTFIPTNDNYQIRYSFNSDVGIKVEDKELLNSYRNPKEYNNNIKNKILESKNENEFDDSDDSDGQTPILKSKYYNLIGKLEEKRGNFRKNLNFDNNNYITNNDEINLYNDLFDDNNKTDNNYNNNTSIFGNSNGSVFNNLFNQQSKRGTKNRMNRTNDDINIFKNLLGNISSKIEKRINPKKTSNDKQNIDKRKFSFNNASNSKSNNQRKSFTKEKEVFHYEKYIKNKKLINLLKQFLKLENIEEEEGYIDENSDDNDENIEINENKKNNSIKKNEYNTIDDYISHKNIDIGKVKRKKRKAKTNIVKKIDFGIEIIKNICEEINLLNDDKEDLFNIFLSLKSISIKPEISKIEENAQKKSLKVINDFIKKYIMELQKSELTKTRPKILLDKYFKANLNDKLYDILSGSPTINIIPRKEKYNKKKARRKPKNIPRKKLIYDNSYFFKSNSKKKYPLKLDISTDLNLSKEKNKENNISYSLYSSPKRSPANKYKPRKAIFNLEKKIEGLKHLLPIAGRVLTEEEKKIERENLLDRRLKAFFEEIKILKNIKDNNSDRLNFLIDKEMEKFDYAQDKTIEIRKYNFFEELRIGSFVKKEKKLNNTKKDLFFQSPLIFNMYKDKNI